VISTFDLLGFGFSRACDCRFRIFFDRLACGRHNYLARQLRFRLQPILNLMASLAPAPLVEFGGTAADLHLKINSGFFANRVCGFVVVLFPGTVILLLLLVLSIWILFIRLPQTAGPQPANRFISN